MAVPKKKTSKSKRDMRRSHDNKKPISYSVSKFTGLPHLPHHIDSSGSYNGKVVIAESKKESEA